jgi:hypothetical protein
MHINEEGQLIIRISGSGNFIQFGEPQVQWPSGIEVLDVSSKEALDKNAAPISGSIEYVYQFTTAKPGAFVIPPVQFSYFDIEKKKFAMAETSPLELQVTQVVSTKHQSNYQQQKTSNFWLLLLLFTVLLGAVSYVIFIKRNKKQDIIMPKAATEVPHHINYTGQLRSIDASVLDDKEACRKLRPILDDFTKEKFASLTAAQKESLQSVTDECNEILYSPFATRGLAKPLIERCMAMCSTVA